MGKKQILGSQIGKLVSVLLSFFLFCLLIVTAVKASTLSGKVINAINGEGIAGARIIVAGLSAISSDDGSYSITDISSGTYNITASKSGFYSRTLNSYPVGEDDVTQDIALTPNNVDVGSIRGYVIDIHDKEDLDGVKIELADGIVVYSRSNGYYCIDDVPIGKVYNLTASYSGYYSRSISGIRIAQGVGFNPPMKETSDTIIDIALTPEWLEVGSISGKVTRSSTGEGISSARVVAGFGLVTVSDADGNYTLDNLPFGTYYLQAYKSGYECSTAQVDVESAITQDFGLKPNSGAGYVWGYVRNLVTNNEINGASVNIGDKTIVTQCRPGTCWDNGYYCFYGISAGQYTIEVSKEDFIKRSTNAVFVKTKEGTEMGMALTPEGTPCMTLSGTVKSSVSEVSLSQAKVWVADDIVVLSDENGVYNIPDLPIGWTFNLYASYGGYIDRLINALPTGNQAGITITQDIALTPNNVDVGSIRGYVIDIHDKEDLDGVKIELADGIVVYSRSNGYYCIDDVPIGKVYNLTASYSGYYSRSISGIRIAQGVGFNPPMKETSDTIIDIALTPEWLEVGSISGKVTRSSTGEGISSARVVAGFGLVTVSDADGNYTLDNLPFGTYYLQAYKSGYECSTAQVDVESAITQDFGLKPNSGAGYVWGYVRNLVTNNEINGASVNIGDKTIVTQCRPGTCWDNGYYCFYGISAGQYQIVAAHQLYITEVTKITISGMGGTKQDFGLQPRGFEPVAKIIQPEEGSDVRGVVTIVGTANDDDLYFYRLEYSSEETPDEWNLIAEKDVPVVLGKLADWNISDITPGKYNLKLKVQDEHGNEATDTVRIIVSSVIFVSGDCNGDDTVSIDEVQKCINCFLGIENDCCDKCDVNSNDQVTIDEVQKVINAFLGIV